MDTEDTNFHHDGGRGLGAWFCNIDQRASVPGNIVANSCGRLQIQDNGNSARQTLFDTGANSIGEGLATLTSPGITWEIGPYRLRTMGAFFQAGDGGFKPTAPPGSASVTGKKRGESLADRSRSVCLESGGLVYRNRGYPRCGPCGNILRAHRRQLRCSEV